MAQSTAIVPLGIEFEQPNKKILQPLDMDRVPELQPCKACGCHHTRLGVHIACLNQAVAERDMLQQEMIRYPEEFKRWLKIRAEVKAQREKAPWKPY